MELRRLELNDLSSADELREMAGWNQTPADWRRLLSLDPEGCFAAVDQDRVVGTATTTCFGSELAWIGMVLVDPSRRNQGIGRRLLMKCLDHLRGKGVRGIKLDATPIGRILYEKMGFQAEWPLVRWMKTKSGGSEITGQDRGAVPAEADDWPKIFQLDRPAFGVDRSSLLRRLGEDSTQAVVCRGRGTEIEGFGFLRTGVHADYIGPVVAQTEEAGKSITRRLLSGTRRSVFWDIPVPCAMASSWAEQLGFVGQRSLLRMRLGENRADGVSRELWGISDPSTG